MISGPGSPERFLTYIHLRRRFDRYKEMMGAGKPESENKMSV